MNKQNVGYLLLLPHFNYFAPESIEEACSLLSQHNGRSKVMAGGTDLLVSMKKREITPEYVISLNRIRNLDYIETNDQGTLRIGALTTLTAVAESKIVNNKFTALSQACGKVGTPQIRNMGTLAGNICQAGPSQDTIPALLVHEASLRLVNINGERIVPIIDFFKGPFQSIMAPDELLVEIQIPPQPERSAGYYLWMTKATEVDETLVGVAVMLTIDSSGQFCEEARIGLTSVAPYPFRAHKAEAILKGKAITEERIERAGHAASEETKPRSRAEYRKHITAVLVRKALTEAWKTLQ